MQDSTRFYVGTGYILPDGSEKPYTIESDYLATREEAMAMLDRMTGKMSERLLRDYVKSLLTEQAGSAIPIRLTSATVRKYVENQERLGGSITMVAEFTEPVALYRVVDASEILKINEGSSISGGKFNTPAERLGGASYTLNFDELASWGAAQTSRPAATSGIGKPGTGRLFGETLFIIEVEGAGETFVSLGSTLDGDKISPENPFKEGSKLHDVIGMYQSNRPTSWRRDYTPTDEQTAEEKEKSKKVGDTVQDAVDYYNDLGLRLDPRACTTGLGCNLRLTKDDIKRIWWFSGFETPQEFAETKEEISWGEGVELATQEMEAMKESHLREHIRNLLTEQEKEEEPKEKRADAFRGAEKFTVGYVLDSLNAYREMEAEQDSKKKAQMKKDYAETGLWGGVSVLATLIPGAGTVVALAKFARDMTKKNVPDAQSSKDSIMNALDIDDRYSDMLDDDLEDQFGDEAMKQLQGLDRDAQLPDMDAALEKFVKQQYDREIDGAQLAKESLARNSIRSLLREQLAAAPVLDNLSVMVRVSIDSPDKPTMEHILTKIRGLPDVITVRQDVSLRPAPEGKQMADLVVRFERGDGYTIDDLIDDLTGISGIDMAKLKTINDTPHVKESVLREFVRGLLVEQEATSFEKLTDANQLEQYANGDMSPVHFMSFRGRPTGEINYQTTYNTPPGFYTYPVTKGFINQYTKGRVPFAANEPYLVVIRKTDDASMMDLSYSLRLGSILKLFSLEAVQSLGLEGTEFEKDVKNLIEMSKGKRDIWDAIRDGHSTTYSRAQKTAKRKNDIALTWNLTRLISGGDPSKWAEVLAYIGVKSVYDGNSSIIHKNEKQQAVFFTPDAYEVVKVFDNQLTTLSVQQKRREQGKYGKHD